MNIKDRFIQQYIPNNQIWLELISTGLSPNSNGQCEAIKRQLIRLGMKDLKSMETWFWSGEKIEEVLSIPLNNHCGKRVSLYENVGIGFHLFERTNYRGRKIPSLWERFEDEEGNNFPILPLGMIITEQVVMYVVLGTDDVNLDMTAVSEEDLKEKVFFQIILIPSDHELFLTASKMSYFLNRKLVNVEKVKAAPRHDRKRWGMNTPESKSKINVVTWRKSKYESNRNRLGIKKNIARHFVRGHWRLQPYPSEGDRVFRPIWIDTYVRGNINAPLNNKGRINIVVK